MENTQPGLNDDLDLIGLIKGIKNLLFKWKAFIRNCVIAGILLGLFYFFMTPKVFESKALFSSEYVKGSSFIILIENLQRHLKEGNIEAVASAMNLDQEVAEKIEGISAYTVKNFSENQLSDKISDDEKEDEESKSGEFVIEVYSSDNQIWPHIQKGILHYIENNEFTKGRSYQKKVGLKLMKNRIHAELNQLDSLKYSVSSLMSGKQGNYYINDPSQIFNSILELYKSELSTSQEILRPDVSVISGFSAFKKPHSPRLVRSIFISIFISLVLCFSFIGLIEIKKRLQ